MWTVRKKRETHICGSNIPSSEQRSAIVYVSPKPLPSTGEGIKYLDHIVDRSGIDCTITSHVSWMGRHCLHWYKDRKRWCFNANLSEWHIFFQILPVTAESMHRGMDRQIGKCPQQSELLPGNHSVQIDHYAILSPTVFDFPTLLQKCCTVKQQVTSVKQAAKSKQWQSACL